MCQKRNSRRVTFKDTGRVIRVDNCLADLIQLVEKRGKVSTVACCCGHGRYTETIVCRILGENYVICPNENWLRIKIPRKRRFYKKDGDGYYYIPEVQNLITAKKEEII